MINFFLYARKSTDVEDKQVRSIDDQLAVLRDLAKTEGLNVIEEFIEKQSAKLPGRPIFNDMLARIEKGEAQGIVCWKLDRLARNPVDGGQISWFLQRGIIQHIQTHDRSYRPADNVLMMSVEFGMANQYILDLSANTKRGLYEKVKRGEYPSIAPFGYLNDTRTKTIVVNRKKSKIVRDAFELYAQGKSTIQDMSEFFAKHDIFSKGNKYLYSTHITRTLTNPFYYGYFNYAGELYEGKHQPVITKQLFDKVQEVLKQRGRPVKDELDPRPLCGLFRCGSCGMGITGENRVKRQQNGNVHHYTYYHCTKKSKTMKCPEPCIREEALDSQLSDVLTRYAMPPDWAVELSKMADKDEQEAVQSSATITQEIKAEIQTLSQKLQRLLDAYLDQDIERENYRSEKAILLSRKKSLEEKMAQVAQGSIAWLEPLRDWIKDAQNIAEIASTPSLSAKKSFAKKIFGLNPYLKNQKIQFTAIKPYDALRASRENFIENELSIVLVTLRGIEPRFKP